jgi:8-oxo-dGTP pyrophosphatase MutT (NUDIX family)
LQIQNSIFKGLKLIKITDFKIIMQNKALFKFDFIKQTLFTNKPLTLPGEEAQFIMAPEGRKAFPSPSENVGKAKDSAVMLFIHKNEEGEASIFLIERKKYLGIHSGQISFPGGKKDETDESLLLTAMRESKEEIGIQPEQYEVIQNLSPLYVPASHFMIFPYLSVVVEKPQLKLHEREVEKFFEVPLSIFFDPENLKTMKMKFFSGNEYNVPYYDIDGSVLWGATAMIMSEFVVMLKNSIEKY